MTANSVFKRGLLPTLLIGILAGGLLLNLNQPAAAQNGVLWYTIPDPNPMVLCNNPEAPLDRPVGVVTDIGLSPMDVYLNLAAGGGEQQFSFATVVQLTTQGEGVQYLWEIHNQQNQLGVYSLPDQSFIPGSESLVQYQTTSDMGVFTATLGTPFTTTYPSSYQHVAQNPAFGLLDGQVPPSMPGDATIFVQVNTFNMPSESDPVGCGQVSAYFGNAMDLENQHPDGILDGVICQNNQGFYDLPPAVDITRASVDVDRESETYTFLLEFGRLNQFNQNIAGGIEMYDPQAPLYGPDPNWYFNNIGNLSFNFSVDPTSGSAQGYMAQVVDENWTIREDVTISTTLTDNRITMIVPFDAVPEHVDSWIATATDFNICDAAGLVGDTNFTFRLPPQEEPPTPTPEPTATPTTVPSPTPTPTPPVEDTELPEVERTNEPPLEEIEGQPAPFFGVFPSLIWYALLLCCCLGVGGGLAGWLVLRLLRRSGKPGSEFPEMPENKRDQKSGEDETSDSTLTQDNTMEEPVEVPEDVKKDIKKAFDELDLESPEESHPEDHVPEYDPLDFESLSEVLPKEAWQHIEKAFEEIQKLAPESETIEPPPEIPKEVLDHIRKAFKQIGLPPDGEPAEVPAELSEQAIQKIEKSLLEGFENFRQPAEPAPSDDPLRRMFFGTIDEAFRDLQKSLSRDRPSNPDSTSTQKDDSGDSGQASKKN